MHQTTDPSTLASALGGTGLTIDSVAATNGDSRQFGTYSNFSLIHNGIVLSSGYAVDTAGPPMSSDDPATDLGQPGTTEFDAYGPGHIANFTASYDVARLQVNFTLDTASAVSFKFIFGSIEYPNWVSSYTDSFLVFLDGTDPSQQITFDSNHVPVQVGTSFSNKIIITNTETAFGDPHGFIPALITTTQRLSAGSHTLLFEVGDVNDHILDSAAFITDFRTAVPRGNGDVPDTEFEGEAVPEPSSLVLLGLGGGAGLVCAFARRGRRSDVPVM